MAVELLPGHRLTLLNSGAEYFPALRQAIDEATRDIRLETYIFADDTAGRMIATALIEAARRGVRVRVLVDGFGSPEFAHTLLPGLAAAGVEAMVYRPELARLALRRHRLRRLHRKLVLIDDRIAFVGERRWQKWVAVICKPFTKAEVKYFDASEIETAWAWVREAS